MNSLFLSDRKTVFVNIGRGSIISEKCLVEALTKNWLAGAILDVNEQEPLRKESPLWKIDNVSHEVLAESHSLIFQHIFRFL